MRVVVQRVKSAGVRLKDELVCSIGTGLCLLVGIVVEDTLEDVREIAEKVSNLRIFNDLEGKINLSLRNLQAEILLVSQFTLYADCSRGRRPSFAAAQHPKIAKILYENLINEILSRGISVKTGIFQAEMDVEIVNWGPVTIVLESRRRG